MRESSIFCFSILRGIVAPWSCISFPFSLRVVVILKIFYSHFTRSSGFLIIFIVSGSFVFPRTARLISPSKVTYITVSTEWCWGWVDYREIASVEHSYLKPAWIPEVRYFLAARFSPSLNGCSQFGGGANLYFMSLGRGEMAWDNIENVDDIDSLM